MVHGQVLSVRSNLLTFEPATNVSTTPWDEGYACRIRVENTEVAQRVIACLSAAFAFQTSEPMRESVNPAECHFRIAYGSELSRRKIVRLLTAIPGLRFRVEPN